MNIKINNAKIAVVDQVKYLGIIIDNRLNFQAHLLYIHKKVSIKTHFLKRISTNLALYTKLLLYKPIVAPHVEYCSALLFMLPNYRIKELQLIQNRCMRIILNCSKYTHIKDMLCALNLMSIKTRIHFNIMITIFKINNHLLPEFVLNKISQKETHNYNLRDPFKFKINRCRTHKTYNTIFFRGLSMYNMLPLQLKECNNLLGFKVHLRQYFKENIVMC
jgi:hypothetical protein